MIRHVRQVALAGGTELSSAWTSTAAPKDGDIIQKELGELQGEWMLVYWLYNGQERSTSQGKIILAFVGEKFTIHVGEVLIEKGAFERLDPDQSPKAIDYAPTEVDGQPFTLKFPAIYLVQDDVLILCVGYGGKRPKTFAAESASENELVIYKRVKR